MLSLFDSLAIATRGKSEITFVVEESATGKNIVIRAFPSDTIWNVKMKIRDQEGYFIRRQELVTRVGGGPLVDGRTVRNSNIQSGHTVFLYVRPSERKLVQYGLKWARAARS